MSDINAMKDIPFDLVNTDGLVDIKDVAVDKALSREERIAEFVRQIKNPYCFKCGNFIVRARFAENGASLENCLQGILL